MYMCTSICICICKIMQIYANAYVSVIVSNPNHQPLPVFQSIKNLWPATGSAPDHLGCGCPGSSSPIHHPTVRRDPSDFGEDLEPRTARELQDVAANANLRTCLAISAAKN